MKRPFTLFSLLLAARCAFAGSAPDLPLMFEANAGQFDSGVNYVARGPGYRMALRPAELVMSLKSGDRRASVGCRLLGADPNAAARGEDQLPCRMSYFLGDDPAQWRADVPTYAKVRYSGVYPGVDLVYYGNGREVEYDFIVAPGADPGLIAFDCGRTARLDEATGQLVVTVDGGEVRHQAPVAYQQAGEARTEVSSSYALSADGVVRFSLGSYDRSRPLVIDPILSYSTYFGGLDSEKGTAMAVDAAGNQYLAGNTDGDAKFGSSNLSRTFNGGDTDVFVLKMRPEGNVIDRGTLIGGNGADEALAIAVDAGGNVYLAGTTTSQFGQSDGIANTLPHAAKPGYDRDANGGLDAFVLKINALFTSVDYSTFLGGSGTDAAHGIALAANGRVWVSGTTSSAAWHFPSAAAWAYDTTFGGGTLPYDGFLVKLDTTAATGQGLEFFSYLGGSETDEARGVAVDSLGNVAVTGFTYSTNFPVHQAYQPTKAGGADAFLIRFSADGSTLLSSTYFGGSESEWGMLVKFDSNNRPYLSGTTNSANFPVVNAAQREFGGGFDAGLGIAPDDIYVTRFNAAVSGVEYSTYLGGLENDGPTGLAVDSQFNAYISGWTASPFFPTNHGSSTRAGDIDGVLVKLNDDGNHINFGTLMGGDADDKAVGVGLDATGSVYVAGWTSSSNFPTTPGALQSNRSGAFDLFFRRYGIDTHPPSVTITSPLGSPRAHLLPFTGTTDDNDLNGVTVKVQILELNPVVRYWDVDHWVNAAPDGSGPWVEAIRSGLGWSVDPTHLPGRADTKPGTYTLRAQAEDGDGNLSSLDSFNVVRSDADTTPPVITFLNPATEGAVITSSNPALTFTVDDPETGVVFALAALRKTENGVHSYWNGTDWQTDLVLDVANQSGNTFSFPNPPSGGDRPNAQYLLIVSASNRESPILTAAASIAFSVDYYPSYTWTGLAGNNSWIDPANWSSTDAPGSAPGAGSIVEINAGTPAIANNNNVYLRELRMSGGSLTVFGTLAIAKKLEMFGGSLHGPVTLYGTSDNTWRAGVITGSLHLAEGGKLTVSGGYDDKFLGSGGAVGLPSRAGTIENFGTMECVVSAGNTEISRIRGYGGVGEGPATINNHSTGVFRMAGDGYALNHYNGQPAALIFNNEGRIVKTAGTGTTSLDAGSLWTFNLQTGSVLENAVAGAVLLRGSSNAITNIADGAIFRGPGRHVFTTSTPLNAAAGSWIVDGAASLELAGCTLACPQANDLLMDVRDDASLHWISGYIHGNLRIPAGVTFSVEGGSDDKLLGASGIQGTLNNAGIVRCVGSNANQTVAGIRGFGGDGPATFNNLPHARLHIEGDGSPLNHYNGVGLTFNNEGRIIKTAGVGTTTLDPSWVLNNEPGAFIENAVSGSIVDRPGGTANFKAGSVFYGPGTVRLSAGQCNATAGAWQCVGGVKLLLDGAILACPQTGALSLEPSADASLRWRSGVIYGNLNIPASATLTVEGGYDDKFLGSGGALSLASHAGTIENFGTMECVVSAGNTEISRIRGYGGIGDGPATITNHGEFRMAGDGYALGHYNGQPAALIFNNDGRIVKTAGSGTTRLDVGSLWTFNLQTGSVLENAVAGAVLLRGSSNAITNIADGAIFRGPGRFVFTTGTPLNAPAGSLIVDGAASLELAGSVLACPQTGSFTLQPSANASLHWISGVIHGNLILPATAKLWVEGGYDDKFLGSGGAVGLTSHAGTIDNFGTMECVVSAGNTEISRIRGYGGIGDGPATITNHSTGVFRMAGDGSPLGHYNGQPAALIFNNDGRIVKTAGSGTTRLDGGSLWTFNLHTGSVLENAIPGSLVLRDSSNAITNISDGAILRGPGRFVFTAATPLNAPNGALIVDGAASLELAGGVLACPQTGSFTLQPSANASLHWYSGVIHGNLILPATAKLWVEGGYEDKFLGSGGAVGLPFKPGTIDNFGIIECVASNAFQTVARIRGYGGIGEGPATINNRAGAVLRIAGDGPPLMNYNSSGLTFNNEGVIHKTAGPLVSDLSQGWVFHNSGTLRADSGNLDFASVINLNPGSRLEGTAAGSCRFTAGTVTLRGTTTIAGAPVAFTGGTLAGHADGTGTLEGGTLVWTGGTLTGTVRNGSTGSIVASGANIKDLETNAVLNNAGNFTWQDGGLLRGIGNSRLNNLAGGSFFARSSASLSNYNGGNRFENSGTLHIGASPGVLTSGWDFVQTATGSLNIEVAGPAVAEFDRFVITGSATLGGTLNATKLNGYNPAVGTTFTFLTATTVSGTFATVAGGFGADYTADTASLRALAASAFSDWAAGYGLSGAAALPGADGDGDGVPLFLEYALGMNPTVHSNAGAPVGTVTPTKHLAMSFTRRSPSDLTYIVEDPFSPAPGNIVAQLLPGATQWTGSATVTETGTGATRSVTVTDAAVVGSPPSKFLRLRVLGPQ